MIHFKDISLRFDDRYLLKNFNLKINKGDKVLLYGRSGIGKSTLFNLLLGFRRPDSGTIYFKGTKLNRKTVWNIRKSVGYVSQDMDLGEGRVSELIQNIFSYRANNSLTFEKQAISRYLEYFYLQDEILDKDLQDISAGEKQRIAIIIALLLQRDLFLLDEVTSALDSTIKKRVVLYFVENKNWTVLVTSHDSVWLESPNLRIIRLQEP